ncbi:ATP-dependent helicase [Paenalcaligenes niemegkensis]|uniref:UvrD-helicase domain-containing protein n=1 Tax=Paenalcaligenes niemegkensis TaxID=2895469 RepID=UPI001EE90331|nr:UvrD-helicase domain-containing protein [Paenalcaligenes niemegkensis]MCQ9617978.1 ATP-dependent helicase [Paenalcaligenes niemegkensis]
MGDIEVTVLRSGTEIARIVRPLRTHGGVSAITYRRKLWRVTGSSIDLDEGALNADEMLSEIAEQHVTETSADFGVSQGFIQGEPENSRILVDAGPGTGKTYMACSRVAAMIRDGVPATRIWIISFTRTAVIELRNRIAAALDDPAEAGAIRIATLDSHAWALQSGFSSGAILSGGYEKNIESTLMQVREDAEVAEYLRRLRHLIIDEGQDIIGVRAELTLAILDALEPECGVTVFADEAQAIYGFTEDDQLGLEPAASLLDGLQARGFQKRSLSYVYRTESPTLREIFTSVRRCVIDKIDHTEARQQRVRADIERLADGVVDTSRSLDVAALDQNTLVLMRRRVDVLMASSFATAPHRLRMSGLPACLAPWLAMLFWDWTERRITKSIFDERWFARCTPTRPGMPSQQAAWQLLFEVAGDSATSLDLHRLRNVLGRPNPPMLFCSPEFGYAGPVLGTIHASKGREASDVILYLPPDGDNEDGGDGEEEIRVMFVGATRARDKLMVGTSSGLRAGSVNGRVWRRAKGGKVQIEIGRVSDLEPDGLVGRTVFATSDEAQSAQSAWLDVPLRTGISARADQDIDWRLALEADGQRLGALSRYVSNDLKLIAKQCDKWPPPGFLPHLRSIGLRTLAFTPDSVVAEELHEPWRSSGFLFAPLLLGLSAAKFPGGK